MKTGKTTRFEGQQFLALLALVMLIWVGRPASGQMTTQQNPTGPPTIQPQDADTRPWQIANFDKFLDNHPELAEQLFKNPSLVNNEEFVEQHPALQQYLQQHPGIREEISENPNAFMRQESRFDRQEDRREARQGDFDRDRDQRREQIAIFDRFLDRHPELAEQLRKSPSLVNNQEFVENHPALQQFLRDNPGVGTEINVNPTAFMDAEERFDRNEDRFNRSDDRSGEITNRDMRTTTADRDERAATGDRDERGAALDRDDRVNGETIVGARAKGSSIGTDNDTPTAQLARADRFFDSHPEIAEQLTKNPALIDNKDFVKNHPALQDFLKSHPEIREEIKENPNAFMRQEARFDQREALSTRSGDRDDMASFGTFLGAHAGLARELSKNPSLAKNKEFQESHPELREFLKTHPAVQAQLTSNPQTVMSSVQATNATKATEPKPKMKH